MAGKLILVVGPSGSGKSALLAHLAQQMPDIIFPVSCTTRAMRPGEIDGEKYHFVTKDEFERRREAGEFLEWAPYGGNYYGTLKSQILGPLAEGRVIMREVEVQGARQIQKLISPESLRIIFIHAGSWENLERRIQARAPITEVELLARRKRYEDETTFKDQAHTTILNFDGGLEEAKKAFVAAIQKIREE
jgi:guanylate kinase